MSKLGLSLVSMLIGLTVGLFLGHALFTKSAETPPLLPAPPGNQEFYYRLNDSMMARHTISVSDSGPSHSIDTVEIQTK